MPVVDASPAHWQSGAMKTFLALAVLTAVAVAEDDGKLTIDIPSAVQAVIAKEKGDTGKIREFKRVNETDGTTYVIGLTMDGKNYTLSLDAAGRVMRKQLDTDDAGPKPVRLEGLPVKVRQTIQREAGAGAIHEIELHEQKPTYVTEVKIGKRKYRIEVDAEGTLLNKEYTGDEE
jgi:uncharacterized membrane protein YkoI